MKVKVTHMIEKKTLMRAKHMAIDMNTSVSALIEKGLNKILKKD
jgi:hypothetical protein